MVEIQEYRGFKIYFNPETSLFHSEIMDKENWKTTDKNKKESGSFEAVKKHIESFVKDNLKFEPFSVIRVPSRYNDGKKITITGIRNDGRFMSVVNGVVKQIGGYDENDYMLYLPENEIKLATLASLKVEVDLAQKKVDDYIKTIKAPTLKEVKHKYLLP